MNIDRIASLEKLALMTDSGSRPKYTLGHESLSQALPFS